MTLTRETMLDRMLASDATYDGRFITGVVSTGIYCLPSCRARKPRPENVVFHATPAEARACGLRPCRRCCPDDFYTGHDHEERRVERLAVNVTRDPGAYRDVNALAMAAGVSASKLHDLFRTYLHTTPAEYLARSRVRAARHALLASARPAAAIAFEVGFESLSAFNDNFRKYGAITPAAFRRWPRGAALELILPEAYPRAAVLRFLGRDAVSLTERVAGDRYEAGLRVGGTNAHVHVTLEERVARCVLTADTTLDAEQRVRAHDALLGLLGLHVDPAKFEAQAVRDARMAALLTGQRGLRPLLLPDPWDALVWAIVGQQVTFSFACALRRRLVERWGTPTAANLSVPPSPTALARLDVVDLVPLGFTRARAACLVGAARAVASGALPLDALREGPATRIERALRALPGVGPWTAHYVLMRGFGFLDCVPTGDSALAAALQRCYGLPGRPSHADAARLMAAFAPYRSLATFHLWRHAHQVPSSGAFTNAPNDSETS